MNNDLYYKAILPPTIRLIEPITSTILHSPSELDAVVFHKDKEDEVSAHEVIRRAAELGAKLGFADLKLCIDRQEEIPTNLRGKFIKFAKATAWADGGLVWFSICYRDRWCVTYGDVDNGCLDRDFVLARRRE
jgi:hypothetical protein